MATLTGKYKVKNSKNSYDVVHLETSANQVIFEDGKTFQDKLNDGSLRGATGAKGDKGDKGDRGSDGLTTSVTVGSTKYTHSNGNITIPAYPTLSSLGAAASSHTHSEYVNQNAFSNVKVGTTTVAADSTTDTIELKAGSNIVLTPDTTNDAITIAVNGLTVTSSEKSNWNSKETTSGSQSKADAALASAKSYTDTKVANLVGSAPETLDTLQELAAAIQGNEAGVSDLLTAVGTKAEKSYVDTELAKKANSSHTHTGSQVTLTGYSKPAFVSAISSADTLNTAIGKLEKCLDSKQAAGSYASSSHDHDSAYLGKTDTAVAATKLANARTINGVSFDGTANITVTDSTKVAPTGTIVANRVAVFNDTTGKVIKDSGFTIATSVPANAKFTDTVYTHPSKHPASMITQDANNRFVSDTEKANWNAKANANNPVFTGTSFSYNRRENTTVGSNSAVIGNSEASGDQAIVIGDSSKATGQQAISIGVSNRSTGLQSIALGTGVNSTGSYSTAMGKSTNATNEYSLSTGCWTTSDGIAASTFGNGSYTNGWGAFSSGIVTKAHGLGQHVFGAYNQPDDNVCGTVGSSDYKYSAKSKHLIIVGNGTSSALSNAYTLDWDGNGWFAGNVTANNFIGNASTATKWNNAIGITLDGAVKGKAMIDGSSNVVITTTLEGVADVGSVVEMTKSLKVTTNWMDTGISGGDLETGTYAIQMFINDGTNTRQYNEFYSGMMSWYSSTTNSSESDEIVLHKAGHAPNERHLYLRTLRGAGHSYLSLQIASTDDFLANATIVFKFKKLI